MQQHIHLHSMQRVQARAIAASLPAVYLPLNPLLAWRGFFVSFYAFFAFTFFGYRQSPPRVGAKLMLE